MTTQTLSAALVISAKDQNLARLVDAVSQKIDKLASAGKRIDGLGGQFNRLGNEVDHASRRLDGLHTKMSRIEMLGRRMKSSMAPVAEAMAGIGLLHGTKISLHAGADIQSEKVKMRAAGIPEAEIAKATTQAYGLQQQFPNVGIADILERYKELRSVLTHPEETPHMLPAVVQAQAAMRALNHKGNVGESLIYAIKAAEVMGLAQDPERFKNYLDAFVRAQQVMGKTITAEQQFDLATNFKASAATLSDRFKTTVGISMAQEMKGMRAGVGVDQFIKQIVGGFQGSQHSAAKEFVALGLANKADFETTKTGEIKGFKPGHNVAGAGLAASDPDLWVYQYLLPAMEKKGITEQNAQISLVRRLFTSSRSADIVAKLIQQRVPFEQHAKRYAEAKGLDAIESNASDAYVALDSLTTSLQSLAGTLTSPAMSSIAGFFNTTAHGVAGLSAALDAWQDNNPRAATAAGYGLVGAGVVGGGALTYGVISGLMSGFGLKGSALALTESAAALNVAALRLGAGGGLPGVPGGAPGAPGVKTPGGGVGPGWLAWLGVAGGVAAGMYYAIGGADDPRNKADWESSKPDPIRDWLKEWWNGGEIGVKSKVEVTLNTDLLEAKVESIVRKASKEGGSTGEHGMPETSRHRKELRR